jgi:hypothetical protein
VAGHVEVTLRPACCPDTRRSVCVPASRTITR